MPDAALVGDVRLRPEHAVPGTAPRPLRYLVVLDAGGSMSANFDGKCNLTTVTSPPLAEGGAWQCANGPGDDWYIEVAGAGSSYWWKTVEERRIYVAKRAAITLARSLNLVGASGYDATRPPDQLGIVWFNDYAARTGFTHYSGFLPGLRAAEQAILTAGSWNGDPYRTVGGSNIAAGLYRAALALQAESPTVTLDDVTYTYDTRVLLITDSVASTFLDKNDTSLYGGTSLKSTFASSNACRYTPDVTENAPCQTTEVGGVTTSASGVAAGMDRPITQAVKVSRAELQAAGARVSVLALGNLSPLGLRDGVASSAADYYPEPTLETGAGGETNVDRTVAALPAAQTGETCTRVLATDLATAIEPERRPENVPLPFPVVGEVILTHVTTGDELRAPISADELTGTLRYSFASVPGGREGAFGAGVRSVRA